MTLNVNTSVGADKAKSYFLDYSRGDYYTRGGEQELVGQWGGHGSRMLGLEGTVEKDAFYRLCDNEHPETGERLTPRTKDNRRVGYDFTFSVPKSVSVLHAYAEDDRILDAFREAVGETMREAEADMQTRVRKGTYWNSTANRTTGNMVWAEFVHFTARPVDGVPDPHMHAHVFAFNTTWDPVEQRWKAGEFGGVKRDAGYYEAACDARMASKLEAMGYPVERTGAKAWEVAGVPESVVEKFSRRRNTIEEIADARGVTDSEGKHRIATSSREKKAPTLAMDELRDIWWNRMLSDQEARALDRVISGEGGGDGSGGPKRPSAKEAIDHAAGHVFERSAVVSEKQLLESALRVGVGSVSVEDVKREATRDGILRLEHEGQIKVSTREVLDEENAMIAFAKRGKGTLRAFTDQPVEFGPVKGENGKTFQLSDEQQRAATAILHSTDRVVSVCGDAGTGKTTLMRTAVNAVERVSGQYIQTLAPSTEAVKVLQEKEGFTDAQTVAWFLKDKKLQSQIRGQVIWIDEAGLLGSRDLGRVMEIAKEQDARVVLSGDRKQHASVSRGSVLKLLEEDAGVKPLELKKITRQKVDTYRDAVAAIAKGDLQDGFDRLDRLGLVKEVADRDTRYKTLAGDYLNTAHERGLSTLVIAPTHAEGARATEAIRDALKEAGKLGETRKFTSLKNRQLTEAQRGDAFCYETGNCVQVLQNIKGFTRGDKLTVLGRDDQGQVIVQRHQAPPPGEFRVPGVPGQAVLPLDKAKHLQVYEASTIEVAVGDKIRISQNTITRDKQKVNNGAVFEVRGFTQGGTPGDPFSDGNLIVSDGKRSKVLNKDVGHIAHGYVSTSHASQGRTVDAVLIAASGESRGAIGKEQFYVSASRGKKEIRLYTDDKDALRQNIERTASDRMTATELLQQGRRIDDAGEQEAAARQKQERRKQEEWLLLQQAAERAWSYVGRAVEAVRETYGRWTEMIQRERGWAPEPPELTR